MKIYFINSKKQNCGVYQYGLRIWDSLKNSKLNIQYYEIETRDEFDLLDLSDVDMLFFNWIEGGPAGPFGWYDADLASRLKKLYRLKTVTIMHTPDFHTTSFDYYIDQDPNNNGFTRPLYTFDIKKQKPKHNKIHVCSFGFAGDHKGFDDVVRKVNSEFDDAVINLHITNAHYGDRDKVGQTRIIDNIQSIPRKPGIELNITTDFRTNDEILNFVHENDIVLLAYRHGKDISGVPDYAISANTPFGVTNIGQFRHVYSENVDINLQTIQSILDYHHTTNLLEQFQREWSRENLVETFEYLVNLICNNDELVSYAQVMQDQFALKLIGKNGYFLDLGAGWDHSGINSNTLLLEQYGWDGICVDADPINFNYRKDHCIRAKMFNVYIPNTTIKEILDSSNAPKVIDYVNVDIDPASMIALNNFPFDEYEFKVMTFEHDAYRLGSDQKDQAYKLLTERGYVRLCDDVNVPEQQGEGLYFEDWWINPKYFSTEFIQQNHFKQCHGTYIINNLKQ